MAGAVVQSAYAQDPGASTTISITLTGVTAGNHIVVHIGFGDVSGSVTASVSDGSSYSAGDSKRRLTGDQQSGQVFYLENVGSGSHSITATFSASENFRFIRAYEVSGLATSSSLDTNTGQAQAGPGTGANAVSSGASSATTNATDFVMGFSENTSQSDPGTGTVTAGTGYTISGSNLMMCGESKSVSATGAQTATFTQSVNNNRITHVVAFKEASGGSGAISGTTTLTFGQSGTLAGAGAIAATAGITLGQSGTLTGAGALGGSASFTFGQSATVTGAGTLAGSIPLTFGQSGTLLGAGSLAGTATLTFGQVGTLTQPGLNGSTSLSFAASGTLTAAGALSGSTSLTFGSSAGLTGSGALAGSSALTFGATGTADQPGALSGTTTLSFDGTGSLSATGDLAGIAALIFAAQGTLDQPLQQAGGGKRGKKQPRTSRDLESLLMQTDEPFANPEYRRAEPPRVKQEILPATLAPSVQALSHVRTDPAAIAAILWMLME